MKKVKSWLVNARLRAAFLLLAVLALSIGSASAADGDVPTAVTTAVTSLTTLQGTIIALVLTGVIAFTAFAWLSKAKKG